ncbi:ATP-binding protein [Cronbergia sp. UHCC 0137]|uniref:ATP-binding response regulator n=1 Tax=Cronbergia sp. UHCC 0137 TaxID=3110239 RepID=UPI002B2040BF|nr:ATP-binding protein [Cronbergia sp. UHCC 0137]MEA5620783.1 ATP-binding protein [Cronbergia sp. UHCC 0137]
MEETLKILVVDNDETDRMTVRVTLNQAGIPMILHEVSDGNKALCVMKKHNYDCVFLDYHLPDQDGLTLIHKLRSLEIKIPLVVLTAQGDEKIAVELMKAGATDYLPKSKLTSEGLARILRNSIRVYRAEMQVAIVNQQLRETNEQLIRKNQELEKQREHIQLQNLKLLEAARIKSQFLATISHELRTPMNAIIGFSQILLRPKFGELTNQQKDMIERILNNGKNLLLLLNEVLDFAKIEAKRLELKPEVFDVSKVVHSAVAEMRSLAEIKKLSLLVNIDLQNNKIFNDPVRVRQILNNLLSNAVKFTESGEIWVEVKEISTNLVIIIVRDTGIGISPRDYKHIFEAFRQVDQGITRKYSGTGLGLAIIDSLVRMMGGKIFIESQLGVGSMFKIELPRKVTLTSAMMDTPGINLDNDGIFYAKNSSYNPSVSNKTSMGYPNLKL